MDVLKKQVQYIAKPFQFTKINPYRTGISNVDKMEIKQRTSQIMNEKRKLQNLIKQSLKDIETQNEDTKNKQISNFKSYNNLDTFDILEQVDPKLLKKQEILTKNILKKSLKKLVSNLKLLKQNQNKKRAAKCFYQQRILKKYFNKGNWCQPQNIQQNQMIKNLKNIIRTFELKKFLIRGNLYMVTNNQITLNMKKINDMFRIKFLKILKNKFETRGKRREIIQKISKKLFYLRLKKYKSIEKQNQMLQNKISIFMYRNFFKNIINNKNSNNHKFNQLHHKIIKQIHLIRINYGLKKMKNYCKICKIQKSKQFMIKSLKMNYFTEFKIKLSAAIIKNKEIILNQKKNQEKKQSVFEILNILKYKGYLLKLREYRMSKNFEQFKNILKLRSLENQIKTTIQSLGIKRNKTNFILKLKNNKKERQFHKFIYNIIVYQSFYRYQRKAFEGFKYYAQKRLTKIQLYLKISYANSIKMKKKIFLALKKQNNYKNKSQYDIKQSKIQTDKKFGHQIKKYIQNQSQQQQSNIELRQRQIGFQNINNKKNQQYPHDHQQSYPNQVSSSDLSLYSQKKYYKNNQNNFQKQQQQEQSKKKNQKNIYSKQSNKKQNNKNKNISVIQNRSHKDSDYNEYNYEDNEENDSQIYNNQSDNSYQNLKQEQASNQQNLFQKDQDQEDNEQQNEIEIINQLILYKKARFLLNLRQNCLLKNNYQSKQKQLKQMLAKRYYIPHFLSNLNSNKIHQKLKINISDFKAQKNLRNKLSFITNIKQNCQFNRLHKNLKIMILKKKIIQFIQYMDKQYSFVLKTKFLQQSKIISFFKKLLSFHQNKVILQESTIKSQRNYVLQTQFLTKKLEDLLSNNGKMVFINKLKQFLDKKHKVRLLTQKIYKTSFQTIKQNTLKLIRKKNQLINKINLIINKRKNKLFKILKTKLFSVINIRRSNVKNNIVELRQLLEKKLKQHKYLKVIKFLSINLKKSNIDRIKQIQNKRKANIINFLKTNFYKNIEYEFNRDELKKYKTIRNKLKMKQFCEKLKYNYQKQQNKDQEYQKKAINFRRLYCFKRIKQNNPSKINPQKITKIQNLIKQNAFQTFKQKLFAIKINALKHNILKSKLTFNLKKQSLQKFQLEALIKKEQFVTMKKIFKKLQYNNKKNLFKYLKQNIIVKKNKQIQDKQYQKIISYHTNKYEKKIKSKFFNEIKEIYTNSDHNRKRNLLLLAFKGWTNHTIQNINLKRFLNEYDQLSYYAHSKQQKSKFELLKQYK